MQFCRLTDFKRFNSCVRPFLQLQCVFFVCICKTYNNRLTDVMLFRSRPDSNTCINITRVPRNPGKPLVTQFDWRALVSMVHFCVALIMDRTTCWIRTKINTPIQSNQLLWKRIMQTKRNTLSLRLLQSSGRNEFTQFDGAYAN